MNKGLNWLNWLSVFSSPAVCPTFMNVVIFSFYFFVETVLERCKVQYFVQPIHINEHRPNMNTSLGQFRQGLSIVAFIKGGFIAKLLYVGLH